MRREILLATKDRITGDALKSILDQQGYSVRSHNKNLLHLDQRLKEEDVDIVLFGEKTVHIFEEKLSQSIQNMSSKPKLAFLLSSETSGFVVKGLQNGIEGFIHKGGGLKDLKMCLQALKDDCTYISPSLSGRITVNLERDKLKHAPKLTCREEEIVHLLKENKTSREIGEILDLSTKTIQNHRQNICNKLGLKGRNKLYEYALLHF